MTDPRYVGLQKEEIPSIDVGDGAAMQLISGEWDGKRGPVESLTGIVMTTVALEKDARVTLPVASVRTVFLYVVRGEVRVGETLAPAMQLVEFKDDGDAVELEATQSALLLFGHGEPYREPVVAHGPFVMNTAEEIMQAVRDYHAGLFA
jgi:hypothetical protein